MHKEPIHEKKIIKKVVLPFLLVDIYAETIVVICIDQWTATWHICYLYKKTKNAFLEKITPSASKVVPEIKLHSKSMSRILLYHFISHVCLFYLFENLRVRTFRKRSTQRQKTGYTKVYQVGRQRLWLINWVIFLQIGGRRKNRKISILLFEKMSLPIGKKKSTQNSKRRKKRDKWLFNFTKKKNYKR